MAEIRDTRCLKTVKMSDPAPDADPACQKISYPAPDTVRPSRTLMRVTCGPLSEDHPPAESIEGDGIAAYGRRLAQHARLT